MRLTFDRPTLSKASRQTSQENEPANVAARLPLGAIAHTGESCPEDGVWCAQLKSGQSGDTQRRLLKGYPPSLAVYEPRPVALLDRWMGTRQHTANVAWRLVAYIDQA